MNSNKGEVLLTRGTHEPYAYIKVGKRPNVGVVTTMDCQVVLGNNVMLFHVDLRLR